MSSATQIAIYWLKHDPDAKLFPPNETGRVRMATYLHISQNLYIAQTGKPLFKENLYVDPTCAPVPIVYSVWNNYYTLRKATQIGA